MTLKIIISFLDKYDLPWLLLAIMTWIILSFSCSWKQFIKALPVGIYTMIAGAALEHFFIKYKFWKENFIMIPINELDLFLVIGPFFSIGIVLIRFLPRSCFGKYISLLFWSGISTAIELAAIRLGFLTYHPTKWSYLYSFSLYFLSLMSALGFYYINKPE